MAGFGRGFRLGDDDMPAKRISTPAGERLSVIMDNRAPGAVNGSSSTVGSSPKRTSARSSNRTSVFTPVKGSFGFGETPRESLEADSFPTGLKFQHSTNIWSELGSGKEGEGHGVSAVTFKDRMRAFVRRFWKWIIAAIFILVLILAIVLGVSLGKKGSSSSTPTGSEAHSGPTGTSGSSSASSSPVNPPVPPPKDFPVGTFSMTTFLDTVITDCTSNPETWRCSPYTIYNTSPDRSLAIFDWAISKDLSGALVISSTGDHMPGLSFQNAPLTLLDKGGASERYRFQITIDKMVEPSGSLTDDDADATCYFNGTTFTGFLYTNRARDYPNDQMANTGNPAHDLWPYAIRAEEVISAGENIPNCYRNDNGRRIDANATKGLDDGSNLCSCLYKNWRTPS